MLFGRKKIETIRAKDLLGLAMRMFKVNPKRMILTILGIGISFSTIFFLISLGYGLQDLILGQISSQTALLTLDVQSPDSTALPIDNTIVSKIKAIKGVQSVDPLLAVPGQIKIGDVRVEASFNGASQNYFDNNKFHLTAGSYPSGSDAAKELTVSGSLVQQIGGTANNIIGKKVNIIYLVSQTTRVGAGKPTSSQSGQTAQKTNSAAGSSNSSGTQDQVIQIQPPDLYTITGVTDDDTGVAYLPFNDMSSLDVPYGSVKVLVDSNEDMTAVKGAIAELGLGATSIADTIDQANKVFTFFRVILVLFGIASLIVAVIGMVNTMTIILLERTREIGIMKIFGITRGDIQKLFMFESLMIGFLGGLSGLLLGFIFSQIFNFGINLLAHSLGGQPVNLFVYPLWFVLTIIGFASFVGLAIGFPPSRKASKVDPLIALSYSK